MANHSFVLELLLKFLVLYITDFKLYVGLLLFLIMYLSYFSFFTVYTDNGK